MFLFLIKQRFFVLFKKTELAQPIFMEQQDMAMTTKVAKNFGKVFANVFGAENAIVSPQITCGSHALTIALFGILRPGDVMLSVTGKPYDTLDDTIFGVEGKDNGSLKDFGVKFKQVDFKNDKLDFEEIEKQISSLKPKMVYIQRSRGYAWRDALFISDIKKIVDLSKKLSPKSYVVVDNCYGEFIENLNQPKLGQILLLVL